jgi:pyruvate/2-oxoglutarate dehydrogenase complex dihydrolipoamide dehydrogenase (E3) component
MSHYKAAVIGAGQAGVPLAVELGKAGWKTTLIESTFLGGSCINIGCTPTKTMVASARVAYLARRAEDYGVNAGPVSVDLARVNDRKQALVGHSQESLQKEVSETPNLDLIWGVAHFTGPKALEVKLNAGGTQALDADYIFIDTGSRPAQPKIPGLDTVNALTSTTLLELRTLPEHLVILGGGYIGLEFAQMFCRFGSRVTVIEEGPHILSHEDDDVAEEITTILREDGVEILLNAHAGAVSRRDDGTIEVDVKTPEKSQLVSGSHLLVAVGQTPNTDSLTLDAAGIETDERGHIRVNDKLETNVPGVYATGDVNGEPNFTHIAFDDFRILRENLLRGGNASRAGRPVPYTVFIDPELGRVGLSEKEAREKGYHIKVARLPMTGVARAREMGETRGFMKAIVDADTEQILGAAILGVNGGEVAPVLQVAMMGKLPYRCIQDAIFSHPTLAESLNNLFTTLGT